MRMGCIELMHLRRSCRLLENPMGTYPESCFIHYITVQLQLHQCVMLWNRKLDLGRGDLYTGSFSTMNLSDLEPVILVFAVSLTYLYMLLLKIKCYEVMYSTFPFLEKG